MVTGALFFISVTARAVTSNKWQYIECGTGPCLSRIDSPINITPNNTIFLAVRTEPQYDADVHLPVQHRE